MRCRVSPTTTLILTIPPTESQVLERLKFMFLQTLFRSCTRTLACRFPKTPYVVPNPTTGQRCPRIGYSSLPLNQGIRQMRKHLQQVCLSIMTSSIQSSYLAVTFTWESLFNNTVLNPVAEEARHLAGFITDKGK